MGFLDWAASLGAWYGRGIEGVFCVGFLEEYGSWTRFLSVECMIYFFSRTLKMGGIAYDDAECVSLA